MKYAGLIRNDFSAAPGVNTTFFVQGCPFHCEGCHNKDTWDFEGGKEFTSQTLDDIINALTANNISRNLCIMGGEPLCQENQFLTHLIIKTVKEQLPEIKIYIWTGYLYEDLLKNPNPHLEEILSLSDVLIDGPYIASLRDITLQMRGSSNQRIIELHQNFDKS